MINDFEVVSVNSKVSWLVFGPLSERAAPNVSGYPPFCVMVQIGSLFLGLILACNVCHCCWDGLNLNW